MNLLVVYPGRFHPFHLGHKASYDYLVNKYSADSVYIATSDVQAPGTSPFAYSDKVAMMTKLGIPASHIARVKNPYQVKELVDNLPEPQNTALIFAVSEKDMTGDGARFKFGTKKNGEPSYMQPMPENLKQLEPLTKHAYLEVTPTVDFKVRGADANSASQIRNMYIKGSDADRDQIITDLYGTYYPELRDIFDEKLGVTAKQEVDTAAPALQERRDQLLIKINEMREQLAQFRQLNLTEEKIVDYIEEKKTRKI
jgi:hypothetical protein